MVPTLLTQPILCLPKPRQVTASREVALSPHPCCNLSPAREGCQAPASNQGPPVQLILCASPSLPCRLTPAATSPRLPCWLAPGGVSQLEVLARGWKGVEREAGVFLPHSACFGDAPWTVAQLLQVTSHPSSKGGSFLPSAREQLTAPWAPWLSLPTSL